MDWAAIGAGIGLFFFVLVMIFAVFSIVIGLPGCWVIAAEAVIYAAVTRFQKGIGWWDLALLLGLAAAAELAEFLITAYGAKRYGASPKAIAGALAGGIVGAFLVNMVIPILGAMIGAFLGVYLGAFLLTYSLDRDLEQARKSGIGAFMGRIGAVLVKGGAAVAMAVIILAQVFKEFF